MTRYPLMRYVFMVLSVMAFQMFFLNNIIISVYFAPVVYVAILVLLPINMPSFAVFLTGLTVGLAADAVTGGAGLYTLALLPVAFFRRYLLRLLCGEEALREGGIPSPERMGVKRFWRYMSAMVLSFMFIIFVTESFSAARLWTVLLRFVVSGGVSVAFTWMIVRIFVSKLPAKPDERL